MRRTARSCPTMRAASFSSNSCARGLFWSGSSRTVLVLIVSLSITATMWLASFARSAGSHASNRLAGGAASGCPRPVGRYRSLLHAKSEPHFFDETFIDVVCFTRNGRGAAALPRREHYIYDNEFVVTTK